MDGLFKPLKSFLFGDSKVVIDNGVFRLHYILTVIILVGSAIVVTFQLFGKPIDCSVDKGFDENYAPVMNTFCWIQSTFSVPHALSDENVAWAKAHPGLGPLVGPEDKVQHHKYYQWVVFVLVFQAILFYIPHYIWRLMEGGKVEMMVMDLNQRDVSSDTRQWEQRVLVEYFVKSLKDNQSYLYGFVFCEILNFVNVVGQIFFTDMFLGYEFTTYGTQVLEFVEMDSGGRIDPMDRIFPKVTKCTFNKYGPSGSVINFDGICVLPLNIVNEKVYVFLWFWFIILAVISGVGLIFRFATILTPSMRAILLRKSVTLMSSAKQTRANDDAKQKENVESIHKRCQTGDWFLLYQLGKNINSIIFRDVIADIAKKFEKPSNLRE